MVASDPVALVYHNRTFPPSPVLTTNDHNKAGSSTAVKEGFVMEKLPSRTSVKVTCSLALKAIYSPVGEPSGWASKWAWPSILNYPLSQVDTRVKGPASGLIPSVQ